MPLSRRKPFNTTINIYSQSAPGIPGTLQGNADARFLHAAHLFDSTPFGVGPQAYVNTESVLVGEPTYSIVPGSFPQTTDYSTASIIEDSAFPGVFWIVHHKETMIFPGEQYYRYHLANAVDLQAVTPGISCEVPRIVTGGITVTMPPITEPGDMWVEVPSGFAHYTVTHCVTVGVGFFTADEWLGPDCPTRFLFDTRFFLLYDNPPISLATGSFRLRFYHSFATAGTVTTWQLTFS